MTLEETIIQNSQVKEAKLYGPSKKAMDNPANGVTVVNPAAPLVIKDCAAMANRYIPHYVFGTYANPFGALNKKVDLEQIKDFVTRAASDIATGQLLCLILDKGSNIATVSQVNAPATTSDDPYGDYGSEVVVSSTSQHHDNIYILSKLFGVI